MQFILPQMSVSKMRNSFNTFNLWHKSSAQLHFENPSMNKIYIINRSHFVYLPGKPIIPHLRRCQGFAVVHYSVTLDALYLGHPRLSLNRGITCILSFFFKSDNESPRRKRMGY